MTRPASAIRARCLAMAWRVISSRAARSVAVAGPSVARAARMRRRVGSARATKTCSAMSSMSSAMEVLRELGELSGPAVAVGVVGVAAALDGKLGEAGLDHAQHGAVAVGFEGE